jgi:ABC-type nitrate/sulfonate/bicarbonate transport system ATPase subunit
MWRQWAIPPFGALDALTRRHLQHELLGIANRQALAKTMTLQAESKAEKFCTCVAKMPKAKTPKISHFIESEALAQGDSAGV